MFDQAKWIWIADEDATKNQYVRFRRRFSSAGAVEAVLHITANSRYFVYCNGRLLGNGPPRGWPDQYVFDTYNLLPHMREGKNVLAVLVHYFGIGNMQWIPSEPGLLAEVHLDMEKGSAVLGTDDRWRVSHEAAFEQRAPRVSIQLGFEEQYDARKAQPDWLLPDFDDRRWASAKEIAPATAGPVRGLQPRDIPFLSGQKQKPVALIDASSVRRAQHVWSLNMRPYFNPEDCSANFMMTYGFLYTQIYAERQTNATFTRFHASESNIKLNGVEVPGEKVGINYYSHQFRHILSLDAGWNSLLVDYNQKGHLPRFVVTLDAPVAVRAAWNAQDDGEAWALLGPFDGPHARDAILPQFPFRNIPTTMLQPHATAEAACRLWQSGVPAAAVLASELAVPIRQQDMAVDDVFARAFSDISLPDVPVKIENHQALAGTAREWTTIHPPEKNTDVRICLDFGREIVGYLAFEIRAEPGAAVDFVGFENRRDDGTMDWTEGTNNSMRFTAAGGRQEYRSLWRRGLRYVFVVIRNFSQPVRLRRMRIIESIYPQRNRGHFSCSDGQLARTWAVGAHTMACCSEDTYVDCPAYEQVHWVGDARNEALVDWAVNGDVRLWRHCLFQAAHSLERSPLVESHVPSAWPNILPAWSFLWMRSCREYLLHTGDYPGAESLWPWIVKNVQGVREHLNAEHLFEIRAFNMFDWADMDTPDHGVVTHQNCLLVLALNEVAGLAEWLEKPHEATQLRALADSTAAAINMHLYDEAQNAYTDALHADGHKSNTFSQQTQTVAYVSGVAQKARAQQARADMLHPREGFVTAGSPFFMFFLLEALIRDGDTEGVLRTIRENWGFMLDRGATTFWEMWSGAPERPTRSHCHGWSAAPTYFLSTYILGVTPLTPGFVRTRLTPHPGDLKHAQGRVPTPHGEIFVKWTNSDNGRFLLEVRKPAAVQLEVIPPQDDAEIEITDATG